MKTDPRQEELCFRGKGRVIQGDGYTVKLFQPFGIRYFAEGKQVTFQLEFREREGGWWFTRGYWGVYVEDPLVWDDETEPIDLPTARRIMSQLKEALRKEGGEKYYQFLKYPGPPA